MVGRSILWSSLLVSVCAIDGQATVNDGRFQDFVKQHPTFVMFFDSKNMDRSPVELWGNITEKYTQSETLKIANVDCREDTRGVCSNLAKLPTMRFFARGVEAVFDYLGDYDIVELDEFLTRELAAARCSRLRMDECTTEQRAEMERCDALSLNELGEREGAVERDIRAATEAHHRLSQEFQRRWEESNRKHNEARRLAQHLLFVVQEHMQRAADESVRQEDERDRAAKTEL